MDENYFTFVFHNENNFELKRNDVLKYVAGNVWEMKKR